MCRRDGTENDAGAKSDPGAGIDPAHDRIHVGARRIKPLDHPAIRRQQPRILIGHQARRGPDIPRIEPDRVIGPLAQRAQRRIRPVMASITIGALINRFAPMEIRIHAPPRHLVETGDRGAQTGVVNPELPRQIRQILPFGQIPFGNEGPQIAGAGTDHPHAVFAHRARIRDQKARHMRVAPVRGIHRRDEFVVATAFIDKSLAIAPHRNDPRL